MEISDVSYGRVLSAFPVNIPERPFREASAPPSIRAEPVDRVEISQAALKLSANDAAGLNTGGLNAGTTSSGNTQSDQDQNSDELSEEEQAQVKDLKARDTEVRAHEAAHAATGGSFAGSPSYEYQVGPDGKRYAVGGEVSIDTSPIKGDPQATIEKLEQVQDAALAPSEPSDQDRKVAQQAAAALREAQAELSAQQAEEDVAEQGGEPRSQSADPGLQQQVQLAASAYERVAALA
ncbi:putative metalloprotease CJM1_0395 family protein [Ponticaulis profundi]|uniref:Metalloprotease CJM1_0395 family protein n=1 Tax=Ponticaulis profundi TaxID=2665222 RepID=A0ABW1SAK0_9PROT